MKMESAAIVAQKGTGWPNMVLSRGEDDDMRPTKPESEILERARPHAVTHRIPVISASETSCRYPPDTCDFMSTRPDPPQSTGDLPQHPDMDI